MNNILEKLTQDLARRQSLLRADKNNHTMTLKELDSEELVVNAFAVIIQSVSGFSSLVDMSVRIGRAIQKRHRLKRNEVTACQLGWFVFISYIELGLFTFRRKNFKKAKHPSYFPEIENAEAVQSLWGLLKDKEPDLFPSASRPPLWTKPWHPWGYNIVKQVDNEVLKRLSPDAQPLLFGALNKLTAQGWLVNQPVLEVLEYYIQNKELDSPVNYSAELDERRRASKTIETESVATVAAQFRDRVFYHLYNVDFRSRVYPNTSWLHEQGSDTAKGMLLLAEGSPLGENGLYWLYVHVANCMGQDKLPLDDRASYTESKLEELLSYAENPTVNTGWFNTDKPWSTLAAAFELKLISMFDGPVEDFVSQLPVFIDGTVSGTQHLVAMSKDEELASYVNLVPTDRPGDLYAKVAELVWEKINKLINDLPGDVKDEFDRIYRESQTLEEAYLRAPYPSQEKTDAWQELARWQNHNRAIREQLFPVFWSRVTDLKERRKVVKRVSMTLGYGVTRYGASQQIIDDAPSVSDYIGTGERLWYAKLGHLIFDVCRTELKGPGRMLSLFEELAERANQKEEYLAWTVPVTNFPVVQQYKKPEIKRTKLKYANTELKVQLESWIDASLNPSAQRAGASPNIVHSLDAAHLVSVVATTNYPTAVIHDSFGCTAGNMEHLFQHVRVKFVELYQTDPLQSILSQLGVEELLPERGQYQIESVLDSDFAFS
jgi:DNA-directed RNA polymerase